MTLGAISNSFRRVLWVALMGSLGWGTAAWIATARVPGHSHHSAPSSAPPPLTSLTSMPTTIPLLHERIARCFPNPLTAATDDVARLAALERSLALKNAGERGSLMRRVAHWIFTNQFMGHPEDAVALLATLATREGASGDGGPAWSTLKHLLDEWARRDPERALQALASLPPDCFALDGGLLGGEQLRAKATADPNGAIQFILDHIPVRHQMEYWSLITREIAALDLDAAKSALTRMTGDRSEAVNAILEKWAETEPLAALRWGSRLTPEASPAYAEVALLAWGKRDPVAALEAAKEYRISSLPDGWNMSDRLVHDWLARDPTAALAWCLTPGHHRPKLDPLILSSLEPQELVSAARAVSPEAERAIAISTAKTWSCQDPPATLAWIQSLPQSSETDQARMAMLASLGDRSNPPEVRAFANDQFETLWRPHVDLTALDWGFWYNSRGHVSGLLELLLDGPDSGRARLQELATPDNKMYPDLLYHLGHLNSPLTAELMAPHLDSIKLGVSLEILWLWSSRDPVDAARFVIEHADRLQPATEGALTAPETTMLRQMADAARPHDPALAESLTHRFALPNSLPTQ